jgi:hypothetical protein
MTKHVRPAATAAPAVAVTIWVAVAVRAHAADVLLAILHPLAATLVVVRLGTRVAGTRFGLAAGIVYGILPLLGSLYALPTFRHSFVHDGLPQVVGLHRPWWLAVGVLVAAVATVTPRLVLAAAGLAVVVAAVAAFGLHPLAGLRDGVHETAWSVAFGAWIYVAGVLGVIRRAPALAVAVGGWTFAVVLYAAHNGYDGAAFWRQLAPATPLIALLVSAPALLVPPLRPARRPADAR